MAKVFLIGVESAMAAPITRALAVERHRIEHRPCQIAVHDLKDADIVFAGGKPSEYLSLLRQVRSERPELPFVVVTRMPEITAWLDALEAGATDYCSPPYESRQIHLLMESALPKHNTANA